MMIHHLLSSKYGHTQIKIITAMFSVATFNFIDTIGEQCVAVEGLLVRYEDIIQKESFERKKEEMKADLSHLVESKQ